MYNSELFLSVVAARSILSSFEGNCGDNVDHIVDKTRKVVLILIGLQDD
jgi:hypothetical protein